MAPPRFVARQLANPQGLVGSVVGGLMNRHNARINRFALAALDAQPSDRVLEIGFGGGATLASLLASAAHVTGVDRSADMVRRAIARHRSEVDGGRAEFLVGTIESLPSASKRFDKLYSVNTVYFWDSLVAGAKEARRVLDEGGRLVLGFLPGDAMARLGYPKDIFAYRSVDEVKDALDRAGFGAIEILHPPATAWAVIVAD